MRAAEALAQLSVSQAKPEGKNRSWWTGGADRGRTGSATTQDRTAVHDQKVPTKPRRFYGSVEIDMVRPVKSFDAGSVPLNAASQPGSVAKFKQTV